MEQYVHITRSIFIHSSRIRNLICHSLCFIMLWYLNIRSADSELTDYQNTFTPSKLSNCSVSCVNSQIVSKNKHNKYNGNVKHMSSTKIMTGLTFKSLLRAAGFGHFLRLEQEEALHHSGRFSPSKTLIVVSQRRFWPDRGPHRMWEFFFVNTVVAGCHFKDASSHQRVSQCKADLKSLLLQHSMVSYYTIFLERSSNLTKNNQWYN